MTKKTLKITTWSIRVVEYEKETRKEKGWYLRKQRRNLIGQYVLIFEKST